MQGEFRVIQGPANLPFRFFKVKKLLNQAKLIVCQFSYDPIQEVKQFAFDHFIIRRRGGYVWELKSAFAQALQGIFLAEGNPQPFHLSGY